MTAAAGAQRTGWYHGWNIIAVCILAGISGNALPINAFSLFLKDWSAEFHAPISMLQLGIGGCGLSCALLAPLAGMIADKYPARLLFGLGLAAMALVCLGISFATQLWQYLALYIVPLPLAVLMTTSLLANTVVSRWFVQRLGLALALTAFGLGIAGVLLPPIVAEFMPALGWRGIWRIGALLIGLVVLPLNLLVLRERPTEREGLHYLSGQSTVVAHHGGGSGSTDLRWRDVFTNRTFWMMVMVFPPMLALQGGCNNNLVPIAASRGIGSQTASVLLSLLSFSQLVSILSVGMLSDRFGNRRPLAGLAFLTAAGGVLIAFGQSVPVLGIGVILAGCGGAFWPLIAAATAREFGAGAVGRVFGLVTFFLPFAVLAPFMIAKTQEMTGSYAPALLSMAAVAVLTGTICLLFMREKPREGDHPALSQ